MSAKEKFWSRGDRRAAASALLLASVLFILPAPMSGDAPLCRPGRSGPQELSTQQGQSDSSAGAVKDRGRTVRLLQKDGTVAELTMEDYLWGVVAAEMPASFEEEALKAQACAARTYTVIKQGAADSSHPEVDVCADSTCCQAYITREEARNRWGLKANSYSRKIAQAVSDTDGLGVLYQGKPIQALFFSSAPGKTVDAVAVWGNAVDYLKSVDSPEGDEVPNYRSQVQLTTEEVRAAALAAYPGMDLSGPPVGWFGPPDADPGGVVTSQSLGGVTLTGGQLRRLFGLRSAAFTVGLADGTFTFSVTGHGHGVGMSQYGANAMAAAGSSFRDILTWYYTGVDVAPLWL